MMHVRGLSVGARSGVVRPGAAWAQTKHQLEPLVAEGRGFHSKAEPQRV